jgi:hypothetical protein
MYLFDVIFAFNKTRCTFIDNGGNHGPDQHTGREIRKIYIQRLPKQFTIKKTHGVNGYGHADGNPKGAKLGTAVAQSNVLPA